MISASIRLPTKFIDLLQRLPKQTTQALDQGLTEGAIAIKDEAVKSLNARESSGKTYGTHVASSPGHAPNTDTGRLAQSVDVDIDSSNLTYLAGTDEKYGADLELGTLHTEERPWLLPAFNRKKDEIVSRVEDLLKEAIQ